jgi:hypothetical protein
MIINNVLCSRRALRSPGPLVVQATRSLCRRRQALSPRHPRPLDADVFSTAPKTCTLYATLSSNVVAQSLAAAIGPTGTKPHGCLGNTEVSQR